MSLALVCVLALAAVWLGLTALAYRQEYLVVLRWPRVAMFVLERQQAGSYRVIHPALLPVAVFRFAFHAVSVAPAALRRAFSRPADRVPSLLSSKA